MRTIYVLTDFSNNFTHGGWLHDSMIMELSDHVLMKF